MATHTLPRYQPDELIIAGCRWARARGIPNHKFSVRRVGDHAHVINCMFDMATLVATVAPAQGFAARVTEVAECTHCFVPTFTIAYTCDTGRHVRVLPASGINTVGRVVAKCADRGIAWDIEVLDREGNDVTFDFPCFAEVA